MASHCHKCGKPVPPGAVRCTHCDALILSSEVVGGPTSAPSLSGRWDVLAALDPFGSQKVYRVRNRTTDEEMALRMLPLSVASEEAAQERIRALIQKGKDLRGTPGILTVLGYEVEDRTPVLLTEPFGAPVLQDRLKKERRLPPEEARRIGTAVAEALAAAHQRGVFHGDLRTGCVLVAEGGEVRVADFGVGRVLSEVAAKAQAEAAGGKPKPPFHRSPESLKTDLPDARGDVYSLGCLLFECLTGERRFPDGYRQACIAPEKGKPFHDPCSVHPEMDPALREVVWRCLAPHPGDRFETAAAAAAALKGGEFEKVAVEGAPPALAPGSLAGIAAPAAGIPPPKPFLPPPPPPPPKAALPPGEVSAPRPAPPPPPPPGLPRPAAAGRLASKAGTPGKRRVPPGVLAGIGAVVVLGAAGWAMFGNRGGTAGEGAGRSAGEAFVPAPPALPGLPPPPAVDLSGVKLPLRVEARSGRIWSLVDGMELVLVPGGDFVLGSEAGDRDEQPLRRIVLSPYFIDRTEVTVGQYRRFCAATGRTIPRQAAGGGETHPVMGVTWSDASAYARWTGRRLPTECEWEKAARGTKAALFPWGEADDVKRRNGPGDGDGHAGPSPAGSYPSGQSPFGALDMIGNAWEWCADWYGADYYHGGPKDDPKGPATGTERVVRGHSFGILGGEVPRTTFRNHAVPGFAREDFGFRCAADPK